MLMAEQLNVSIVFIRINAIISPNGPIYINNVSVVVSMAILLFNPIKYLSEASLS